MDSTLILNAFGAAIGYGFIFQWLKNSHWFPWITHETEVLNRYIGVIMAGLLSLGIHYEWSVSANSLTLFLPTWLELFHHLRDWFVQWAMQQYVYKTGVRE